MQCTAVVLSLGVAAVLSMSGPLTIEAQETKPEPATTSPRLAAEAATTPPELTVTHVMYDDPVTRVPDIEWIYSPELKPLWKAALQRPDSELQRLAADTVALAHRQGMEELQSVAGDLLRILANPETSTTVRRAAVHALVALDVKDHASALADAAREYGLDLQTIVEPALARWKSDLLREEWQRRLSDSDTPPRLLELAISGLGALQDATAQPALLAIVLNEQAPHYLRLSAARALAAIGKGGMLDSAQGLLANREPVAIPERLMGVQLLSADRQPESLTQLCELATDPEPAVVAAALERVFAIEPARIFPLAPAALKSNDANVRKVAIRALLLERTAAAVDTLATALDDPNPSLRRHVAKGLFDLAEQKSDLRPQIESIVANGLGAESWRLLEQSALLAGYLGHKPVAPRLIELLKHDRREVAVGSAWALRALKIPETYAPILAHAQNQHARHLSTDTPLYLRPGLYAQLTQIFQLFGEVRYAEADPLLRQYVPKIRGLEECRPAACWALGKIYAGKAPADLADEFAERVADINSMPTEEDPVRIMCAAALGRMKAEAELPTLRRFASDPSAVGIACYWSIEQITGEKAPAPEITKIQVLGWFLQPVDDR